MQSGSRAKWHTGTESRQCNNLLACITINCQFRLKALIYILAPVGWPAIWQPYPAHWEVWGDVAGLAVCPESVAVGAVAEHCEPHCEPAVQCASDQNHSAAAAAAAASPVFEVERWASCHAPRC